MDTLTVKLSTLFAAQVAVIVLLPYLLWQVRWLRKHVPLGVLQIVVGIALGPMALGSMAPEIWSGLFPSSSHRLIEAIGWFAVMVFCCVVGMGFCLNTARRKSGRILAVSLTAMLLPLALGTAVGLWLDGRYPSMRGPTADTWTFAVGLGVCIAVTAMPILALILKDMGIESTDLGRKALSIAVMDDAVLWVLLAAVVMTVEGDGGFAWSAVIRTFGMAVLLVLAMAHLVRPLLAWVWERTKRHGGQGLDGTAMSLCISVCGLAAASSEAIGLHFVIGAFLAGTVMPKEVADRAVGLIMPLTSHVLLPFFFVGTSFKAAGDLTQEGTVTAFALATAVAVGGKLLGAAIPLRLCGDRWIDGLALGSLLQAKGLMEVVALRILLDADVISGQCFAAFMLMAITTTVAAKPMAAYFLRQMERAAPSFARAPIDTTRSAVKNSP